MIERIKFMSKYVLLGASVILFVWGMLWLTKNGGYFFFYEEMVKETIREMVKPELLK